MTPFRNFRLHKLNGVIDNTGMHLLDWPKLVTWEGRLFIADFEFGLGVYVEYDKGGAIDLGGNP